MKTIIGWDAEEAFAQRMVDAARSVQIPGIASIVSEFEAGEFGLAVADVIRAGVPVSAADVDLALRAFSDDSSPHVAKWIRRAVEHAKIAA